MILNSLADHHDDDQQYEDRGVVCGQGKARATNVFPISPYTRTLYLYLHLYSTIHTLYPTIHPVPNYTQPYIIIHNFTQVHSLLGMVPYHTQPNPPIPTSTQWVLPTFIPIHNPLFFSIPYCSTAYLSIPAYTAMHNLLNMHIYITMNNHLGITTSGGTLRQDNCQLIGLSLIVLARQAKNNGD